jgi:IBR domain, a half RING-finger domain
MTTMSRSSNGIHTGDTPIDDETAALLLQLQLDDLEEIAASSKGKSRIGEISDKDIAIQLYKQELEAQASIDADRRMSRSIALAVQSDGPALTESASEQTSVEQNRRTAYQLSGLPVSGDTKRKEWSQEEMDEEFVAKLAALYMFSDNQEDEDAQAETTDSNEDADQGESSSWAGTRAPNRLNGQYTCTACQNRKKFSEVLRVSCGHEYCQGCIQDLFGASTSDESLFPPRCCGRNHPISVASVRPFLTAELVLLYGEKMIEFESPDRTYCSSPNCSTFIRPTDITNDTGTCVDCGSLTCIMCKEAGHDGDCPKDTGLQLLLATAREAGWQRCSRCRRVVELDMGCNHMT